MYADFMKRRDARTLRLQDCGCAVKFTALDFNLRRTFGAACLRCHLSNFPDFSNLDFEYVHSSLQPVAGPLSAHGHLSIRTLFR